MDQLQTMFTINSKDEDSIRVIMKDSNHSASERTRAHCLYLRAKQYTIAEAADILDITARTVINITSNYRDGGLKKAVVADARPGRPPVFDDRVKAEIVALVCSNPPEGFDRWTLELLQETVQTAGITEGIGKETLRLILQEHDLKPWQHKMWCIGDLDEEYLSRMEKILDIYAKDYDKNRPVVCIDEKPVTLTADIKDPMPMKPGSQKKVDYEYERKGSINVFSMVEPKAGVYVNKVTESKKSDDFAQLIADIAEYYKGAKKIVLIMDNYCTHSKKSVVDAFGEEKGSEIWNKFEIYFTPVHASWLNQAEIAIGMYQRQCLGDCRIPDIKTLEKKTLAWNRAINQQSVTINWKFNKEKAREKFKY